MNNGVKLAELTYEEVKEAYKKYSIVMLPIGGGTKEHGPHLPCGTDQMIVEELAERVVESAPVMMLPNLSYAYYPAFVDWEGSVSIEANHFINFIGDIIRSFYRQGIKKFLLLDGGISTHPPLLILSSDLHNELDIEIAITKIEGLGKEMEDKVCEQKRGGHAGETETSQMLAINSDLVQMNKAVEEYRPHKVSKSINSNIKKISLRSKMRTKSGIHGNAKLANAKKGEKILQAKADDIIKYIKYFEKNNISGS